jgi:hypothetical protein
MSTRAGAGRLVKRFVEFLGSRLENVPHQYNFVLATADDRRVTRGGPAAVLERSMRPRKLNWIRVLRPRWTLRPWTEEPREAAVVGGI